MVDAGKPKKVAICAIMRKMLVVMRAMLITESRFNPGLIGACGKRVENKGKSDQKLPISA